MIILGVDPGLTGALAWLRCAPGKAPEILHVQDVPTVKARFGRSQTIREHIDVPTLAAALCGPGGVLRPDSAIIEEVQALPKQGLTSAFRFGFVAGALQATILSARVPLTRVQPQVWKPAVGLPPGSDKGASRRRVLELFPASSALFSREKDHGRAEAVLLAAYHFSRTR